MISKLSRLLGNISFLEANPRLQICALYKFGLYPPQMVPSAGSRSRYWWVPRVWRLDSGPNLHPEIRHWFAFRPPIHHQASFRFLKECRWQHVQGYRIMSTSIRMVISWENGRPEDPPKKKHAHPGRLRWNTIMEVWKRMFLSIGWFLGSMLISRCAFVLDFLLMGHRVQQCELFGEFYFSSPFICPCWLQNKNIHDEFWRLMIIQSTQTQKTSTPWKFNIAPENIPS